MKLDDYLKCEIIEQGWVSSFTKKGTIEVYSRKNWEDYYNIFVKYISNDTDVFFKLTRKFPTLEQFKTQIVCNDEDKIKEIYDFICSPNKHSPNNTVYNEIQYLFIAMENEKLPHKKYMKMFKENTLEAYFLK